METSLLIANLQGQAGEPAVISFHDIELCTRKHSSEILGYYHVQYGSDDDDIKHSKAITKGHKVAVRAAELVNHHETETMSMRVTDSGLIGGSPCEGHARLVEGITWFEKILFDFHLPVAKGGLLTSTNYLHFSSPVAQIVPDDFDLHGLTIITGTCLFSAKILQSSIPPGKPIDVETLQHAGPTLYEVEYIARAAPVIADFAALLSSTSVHHQGRDRRLNLCLDIPSFHYYQSIDQRLREESCTFQQALQWLDAVEKRHAQISSVFRHYIDHQLSRRHVVSLECQVQVQVSPSADWVCSILRQFLTKEILPSLGAILHALSTHDPIWASFFRLIPEKEKPHDFRSFGQLFYVFQVVKPALVENIINSCHREFTRSSPTAEIPATRLARLLVGIDDGIERRIYSRAQKVLKKMRILSSDYPVAFSLLEVYLCRRVFINRNQTGSNLYLEDPSPDSPVMGACTSLSTGVDTNCNAPSGKPISRKLDPFDVVGKLYEPSAGKVLKELFTQVGLVYPIHNAQFNALQPKDVSQRCIRPQQRSIPGVWMRSGTSKGLFIHRKHLPDSTNDWEPILLAIMGSRDGNLQQTDGIGGGTSTTSKVAVVSRSKKSGVDVDYTFVQVDFTAGRADMSGTCGNMAAGVGTFALDEGLVKSSGQQERVEIKVFDTNTGQTIQVTVQVMADGKAEESGNYRILADLIPPGSPIKVMFRAPGGGITGQLFPSGERTTHLPIECPETGSPFLVRTTLIDCTNLFVFVDATSMPPQYHIEGPTSKGSKAIVETIRRAASIRLGLCSTIGEAAQRRGTPKIAILAAPGPVGNCADFPNRPADVEVTAFSMGNLHPTLQLTGAICLGAALSVPNTIASDCLRLTGTYTPPRDSFEGLHLQTTAPESRRWCIKHPAGWIDSKICVSRNADGEFTIDTATVVCTARKLFQGSVFYRLDG